MLAVSTDWRRARLGPADYAMLEFSEKLTGSPRALAEKDLAGLRQHGFSDREILSITLAASYRNFITRVADGLGVELRRGGSYLSEILHAFGVSEAEARTTIYGDRQVAREAKPSASRGAPRQKTVAAADEGICGIETTATDKTLFEALYRESLRLTGLHPMRNLALAFGLRSDALKATLEFGRLLGMGGSGLGRRLEAIIGLVVAATGWMPYLGAHHAQALLDAGGAPHEVEVLVGDLSGTSLARPEREVARYCEKLTREPGTMARSDLESMRRAGFDDRDLATIAASASFENFLGRVAAGVLVRPEEDLAPDALRPFQMEEIQAAGAKNRT
ncbi:MAG: hypothetical protein HYY46_18085 [Deltaproteobacteria bacterium]|nr:hypothetical protein [Deltaproteobacteria bacterium]